MRGTVTLSLQDPSLVGTRLLVVEPFLVGVTHGDAIAG